MAECLHISFIWETNQSKMEAREWKISESKFSSGSALILAVVLTSLLAIVGVLFVMVSRVDKMATSSISENKELNFAVETVVAKISEELVLDVPGIAGQEYYDYPDVNDAWLASLQPEVDANGTPIDANDLYYWRQISDIGGSLAKSGLQTQNVSVDPPGTRKVIQDHPYIQLVDGVLLDQLADADGDGIADSKWIEIDDITFSKSKPIYAAVRIIDNGGMLNANTGFKFNPIFDPCDPKANILDIGGPDQLQINLMALVGRPGQPPTLSEEQDLLEARANRIYGLNPWDFVSYKKNVIWSYDEPNGPYTPFDISDELELRSRFCINSQAHTRLERIWYDTLGSLDDFTNVPYDGYRSLSADPKTWRRLDDWCVRISNKPVAVYPDMRHLVTTYNMDRIINPIGSGFNGGKMVNVNKADENLLYEAIKAGLLDADPNFVGVDRLAAQLAVNIVDLRDAYHSDPNAEVTVLPLPDGSNCYGFEVQPFISDVAFKISGTRANISTNNHFAIELYNPFDALIPLSSFRLEIRRHSGEVVGTINLDSYVMSDYDRFVVTNNSGASNTFGISGIMSTGGGKEDPALVLAEYDQEAGSDPRDPNYVLKPEGSYDVYLIRTTSASDIYLDRQQTKDNDWFDWNNVKDAPQYYSRADNDWNVVLQNMVSASNTLRIANGLNGARTNYNFYVFAGAFERFASVGDIARVLTIGPRPTTEPEDMIGMRLTPEPAENAVRLDLQNPLYEKIFQYLTVIDPTEYLDPPDPNDYTGFQSYSSETRIKGRINVNTAPWFVVAQLPWMQDPIAQAIVAYRDTTGRAFESTASLMQVPEMGFYANDPNYASVDLNGYPDLTSNDGAVSDFEERDVIFSRISNIATVRSDVFTAYILVRVGVDGPQKRVLAILDRSRVTSPGGKVRILALHPVPDPR